LPPHRHLLQQVLGQARLTIASPTAKP
jgi:hypothetical protein